MSNQKIKVCGISDIKKFLLSLSETMGSLIGQSMSISGSFHMIPTSELGL